MNTTGPSELPPRQSFAFKLARVFLGMRRLLRQNFLRHGHDITPEQWGLLNQLYLTGGMSQSQLAEMVFKDKPTVTRILTKLENRNLVVRGRDTVDRRRHRVYLTDQGRELRAALYPIVQGLLVQMEAGVPPDEFAALNAGLDKIILNLE